MSEVVNMQKIADLAGVSRATVSRVLSTPDKVKPETREAIQNIIRECGYIYHAGAADLLKKKDTYHRHYHAVRIVVSVQ